MNIDVNVMQRMREQKWPICMCSVLISTFPWNLIYSLLIYTVFSNVIMVDIRCLVEYI